VLAAGLALGPAKRVTAMSGISIPTREFRGEPFQTEADDNSFLLLDFGDAVLGQIEERAMLSRFGL
jgi:hypothetical protein